MPTPVKKDPNMVTVYSPDGEAETHTRANARDLVNANGYSWKKKGPSTPAGVAPFAVPLNKQYAKTKAQEVLDSIGGSRIAHESTELDGDSGEDAEDEGEEEAEDTSPAPAIKPKTPRKKRTVTASAAAENQEQPETAE